MTLIELVIFAGLPTCLVFCYAFPLRGAFRLSLMVGMAIAFASAIFLLLAGLAFRLRAGRWSARPVFQDWWIIALALATAYGVLLVRQSCWAILGFAASVASFLALIGPTRFRRIGSWCFVALILAAICLHVVLRNRTAVNEPNQTLDRMSRSADALLFQDRSR